MDGKRGKCIRYYGFSEKTQEFVGESLLEFTDLLDTGKISGDLLDYKTLCSLYENIPTCNPSSEEMFSHFLCMLQRGKYTAKHYVFKGKDIIVFFRKRSRYERAYFMIDEFKEIDEFFRKK